MKTDLQIAQENVMEKIDVIAEIDNENTKTGKNT